MSRKVTLGFNTNVNQLKDGDLYDLYKQIVNQTNKKINRMTKGLSPDSKEVFRVNNLVDKANAVKSGGKLVDRSGAFVRTNSNGVRLMALDKKGFNKLNIHQKRALIKSYQKLNTSESYGKKTFSKQGMASYFNRSEEKMRTTIRGYINANSGVTELIERNKDSEEPIDIENILKEAEDRIVERIYNEAKNRQSYSSEQIADNVTYEVLKEIDIEGITKEEIEELEEEQQEENEDLDDFIERGMNFR